MTNNRKNYISRMIGNSLALAKEVWTINDAAQFIRFNSRTARGMSDNEVLWTANAIRTRNTTMTS